MLKTIVGHFFGDRDAYMTTELPGINGCSLDIARGSDYGTSPPRGKFRLDTPELPSILTPATSTRFHPAYLCLDYSTLLPPLLLCAQSGLPLDFPLSTDATAPNAESMPHAPHPPQRQSALTLPL